jgi:hypothetical protein
VLLGRRAGESRSEGSRCPSMAAFFGRGRPGLPAVFPAEFRTMWRGKVGGVSEMNRSGPRRRADGLRASIVCTFAERSESLRPSTVPSFGRCGPGWRRDLRAWRCAGTAPTLRSFPRAAAPACCTFAMLSRAGPGAVGWWAGGVAEARGGMDPRLASPEASKSAPRRLRLRLGNCRPDQPDRARLDGPWV